MFNSFTFWYCWGGLHHHHHHHHHHHRHHDHRHQDHHTPPNSDRDQSARGKSSTKYEFPDENHVKFQLEQFSLCRRRHGRLSFPSITERASNMITKLRCWFTAAASLHHEPVHGRIFPPRRPVKLDITRRTVNIRTRGTNPSDLDSLPIC